jgi:hypothetical protein
MAKSEDQQAAQIVREFENRIVWLAAFLVNRGTTHALNSACAKAADEYQTRFPAEQRGLTPTAV